MTALFGELLVQAGATDGDLSAHLRKLDYEGYIRADKNLVDRMLQTRPSLTPEGRKVWRAQLDRIDALRSAAGD